MKEFNAYTEMQQKIDKMPFMLTILFLVMLVTTFFVIQMFMINSAQKGVNDAIYSTEYLIEKLQEKNVISRDILYIDK